MKQLFFISLSLAVLSFNLKAAEGKDLKTLKSNFAAIYNLNEKQMKNLITHLKRFNVDLHNFFSSRNDSFTIPNMINKENVEYDGTITILPGSVTLGFDNCPHFTNSYNLLKKLEIPKTNTTKEAETINTDTTSLSKKSNLKLYLKGGAVITAVCIGALCYFYPQEAEKTASSLWNNFVNKAHYLWYKYVTDEPWKATQYMNLKF